MNKFEKVSFKQYNGAFKSDCDLTKEYEDIKLPKRATKGSAGYDIFSPFDFQLEAGETIKIPTGIRVHINDTQFLGILPRSGHGFKFRIQLDNTMGVIDSDYINSDNEGHIMIKITNDGYENKRLEVRKGEAFAQGIFFNFDITEDDEVNGVRNGGFGSTTSIK
jgi:dUTP pyrophosphatase